MVHLNRTLTALAVAGLALFLASCGGSGASDASTPVTPSVQSPTPVAATSPRPVSTATTTATAPQPPAKATATVAPGSPAPTAAPALTPSPTASSNSALLAQGKLIFEKTAGGLGCAFCHGLDGRGVGPAQITAPNIRSKSEGDVRAAIQGGVAMMGFIKLTDEDITAVAAYLQYLATQP